MSDEKPTAPAVVIPLHQQSSPKEHPADKEIRQAARELDEGLFIPDPDPERDHTLQSISLALGLGDDAVARGDKPTLADFRHTQNFDAISRHPRVIEALEKMKSEVYEPKDNQQLLERTFAERELAEAASASQRWDGQGRWEGHENEEMRYGRILTPQQFHDRLVAVIGPKRVYLSPHVVRASAEARSGRVGLYVRNPNWQGAQTMFDENPALQAEKLQLEGRFLVNEAKVLRRKGRDAEADKKINKAGDMAEAALALLAKQTAMELRQPEMLRVGVLQWPYGTEWMIMRFAEFGAVWAPKFTGWRTALLTMIRAKAITEKEANFAFPVLAGPLGNATTASQWYLEQLQFIRNDKGTIQ